MTIETLSQVPESERITLHLGRSVTKEQAAFLRTIISTAAQEFPAGTIGAAWCCEETNLTHRLPKDERWSYYLYREPASEIAKINQLEPKHRLPELHGFTRIIGQGVSVYMAALRSAFVDDVEDDLKPAGFILRRHALILFFDAPEQGLVLMSPDLGGHDTFAELEAIQADFCGLFRMNHEGLTW